MRAPIAVLASLLLAACGDNAPPPKAPPRATSDAPEAKRPEAVTGTSHSAGASYDEALAEPEDVMALHGERELTNAELTAPVKRGEFLSACGVPDSTSVTLKIAVRDGRAIGVSVIMRPDDAAQAECVDHAVRELSWPASKKRDSFVTTY